MESVVSVQETPVIGASFPRRFRVHHPRTRSGCLTCRRRRKKCDELKPTCLACWRNCIQCTWPVEVPTDSTTSQRPASSNGDVASSPKDNHEASQRSTWQDPSAYQTPPSDCLYHLDWTDNVFARREVPRERSLSVVRSPGRLQLTRVPSQRALASTASSCTLLSHYLAQTAALVAPISLENNVFLTVLVPMAYTDDLLMHAILALSGAHLDFREGAQPQIQHAASVHYGLVLRGLRHELTEASPEVSTEKMLRLSLVLVLLCHVEVRFSVPEQNTDPNLTWFS